MNKWWWWVIVGCIIIGSLFTITAIIYAVRGEYTMRFEVDDNIVSASENMAKMTTEVARHQDVGYRTEECKTFAYLEYADMSHRDYTVYDYEVIKSTPTWVECCAYFEDHSDGLYEYGDNATWRRLVKKCGVIKI